MPTKGQKRGKAGGSKQDGRRKISARVAKLLAERREVQAYKAYRKAIKRFRPRKGELGKLVFLTARPFRGQDAGQRTGSNARRQVYAVYVTKTGKVIPYKDRKKRKQAPRPISTKSIDPNQFGSPRARTIAKELFFARTSKREKRVGFLPRKKKRESTVDFERVSESLAKRLDQIAARRTVSLEIKTSALVKLPDGSVKAYNVDLMFHQQQGQGGVDFYRPKTERELYAALAQQIGADGFVTAGSAQSVKKLKWNKGQPRNKWLDSKQQPWRKRNLETVKILRIDTEIREVRITNENEPF